MITISDGTTTVELNGAISAELDKERVRYRKSTGEDVGLVTWLGIHVKQLAVNRRLQAEQQRLQEEAAEEFREMAQQRIDNRRDELIAELERR